MTMGRGYGSHCADSSRGYGDIGIRTPELISNTYIRIRIS